MRRDPDTPNGLTEFLVARGLEQLRATGVEEVSLNFAAFARFIHEPRGLFERLAGRLLLVADSFFQIERLHRFNAKFFPRWEPRYLVCEGATGLPRAGLAAMWAEGQLPKPRVRRNRERVAAYTFEAWAAGFTAALRTAGADRPQLPRRPARLESDER